MQVTLYHNEEDEYLLRLVDERGLRERKSRSAVIMGILEEYFERDKRLGAILVDIGVVSEEMVEAALHEQATSKHRHKIGEILVKRGFVKPEEVKRALLIQERARGESQ